MSRQSPEPNYDDISTIPFVQQRAYGSLYRQPITFVPAESKAKSSEPSSQPKPSFADYYNAFLKEKYPPKPRVEEPEYPICNTCNEPIKEADERTHVFSIAHRLGSTGATVPSSIDRSRMGLKYLQKYGFDVDARKGLGRNGEGIAYPLKPEKRQARIGIGLESKKPDGAVVKKKAKGDAGTMRKQAVADKKKAEQLKRMFYGDDKINQYLEDLGE